MMVTTFTGRTRLRTQRNFFRTLHVTVGSIGDNIATFVGGKLFRHTIDAVVMGQFQNRLQASPQRYVNEPSDLLDTTHRQTATQFRRAALRGGLW